MVLGRDQEGRLIVRWQVSRMSPEARARHEERVRAIREADWEAQARGCPWQLPARGLVTNLYLPIDRGEFPSAAHYWEWVRGWREGGKDDGMAF